MNDRWQASFQLSKLGKYLYTVEGWVDPFLTWAHDLSKRIRARSVTAIDFEIGARLVDQAITRANDKDRTQLKAYGERLRSAGSDGSETGPDENTLLLMRRYADRALSTKYHRELTVVVEREKALFSSWYEFFPRSTGAAGAHGTFRDAQQMLPYVQKLGFDVVYLPPIHPVGKAYRKGKNNSTVAAAEDVGSPWAIGSADGGHQSVHPDLGSLEDFIRFRENAESRGMEVALDIAFQASPDHPLVKAHPEWFLARPDGTIQYAENPPKKYQDIYPFHFETTGWKELWAELRDTFLFWAGNGVKIFRVDNPHTKPLPFWEWVIDQVRTQHPDVIFLSEAFTRPKIMYYLAKAGFSQSYTYFSWRNTKYELEKYFVELTQSEVKEYFRPNAWPNTPDILPEMLQHGGRNAFFMRAVLAGTLSSNYGIYGPSYELLDGAAPASGSEEYLNSEKYELKAWDLGQDDSLAEVLGLLNQIRRDNKALQSNGSLQFHPTDNEMVLCYSKQHDESGNIILVVVNLDPYNAQSSWLDLSLEKFGLDPERSFQAHDLLSFARYQWQGRRHFVKIDPNVSPAHIFRLRRQIRKESDFEYFL